MRAETQRPPGRGTWGRAQAGAAAGHAASFSRPAAASRKRAFVTRDGTPVAFGQPDGKTVRKFIRGSKHFLRKPPAVATDEAILLEAKAAGFTVLEVVDTETGVVYTAAIERVLAEGIAISRGFGEQRALRLERWARRDPRQLGLFVAEG